MKIRNSEDKSVEAKKTIKSVIIVFGMLALVHSSTISYFMFFWSSEESSVHRIKFLASYTVLGVIIPGNKILISVSFCLN